MLPAGAFPIKEEEWSGNFTAALHTLVPTPEYNQSKALTKRTTLKHNTSTQYIYLNGQPQKCSLFINLLTDCHLLSLAFCMANHKSEEHTSLLLQPASEQIPGCLPMQITTILQERSVGNMLYAFLLYRAHVKCPAPRFNLRYQQKQHDTCMARDL